MNPSSRNKIEHALKLEFTESDDIWLTKQKTLRKLIGLLGMLLPLLLWLSLYLFSGHTRELESISHYYYTRSNGIFIITVSLLAIFLLIYKGKARLDFYLSSAAGIFALCLLLFPTDNLLEKCEALCDLTAKNVAIAFIGDSTPRVTFHFVSAAIFLLSLAAMSMFLFTKSDTPLELRPRMKFIRNTIYRTCSIFMVVAVVVVFPGSLLIPDDFYNRYHLTFWMETVAVESFGYSWLVKAEVFFKD